MNAETKPLHAAQIPITWGFYYWQPLAFITIPLLLRSFAHSYLHRTRGNLDEEHEFASEQKKAIWPQILTSQVLISTQGLAKKPLLFELGPKLL